MRVVRRGLHPDLVLLIVLAAGPPLTERTLRPDAPECRQDAVPDTGQPAEAHGRHCGARLVVRRLERDVLRQLRLAEPLVPVLEVTEDPRVALCIPPTHST